MIKPILLLLAAVCCCCFTQVQCRLKAKTDNQLPMLSDEARLYSNLTTNYDAWNPQRALIPKPYTYWAIRVNFGLALIYFDFENATKTASLQTWHRHQWTDEYLRWTPEQFGGLEQIQIPISQIWRPDIVLYNSFEPSESFEEDTLATVSSDGSVLYIPRMKHTVRCSSNSTHVSCRLKFASWAVSGFQLHMHFYAGQEEVDVSEYVPNDDYVLAEQGALMNVTYYTCCDEPRPDLNFNMLFTTSNTW